jgi:hypothetical protein
MEPIFSYDVSMNEYKLSMGEMNEDERFERSNTLPNSQLKNNDSLELTLKKLHEQKIKWRLHSTNSLSWAFYCAIDALESNVKVPQFMQCGVFHTVLIGLEILTQQTRLKKGLMTYFNNNPIYLLKVSFLKKLEP